MFEDKRLHVCVRCLVLSWLKFSRYISKQPEIATKAYLLRLYTTNVMCSFTLILFAIQAVYTFNLPAILRIKLIDPDYWELRFRLITVCQLHRDFLTPEQVQLLSLPAITASVILLFIRNADTSFYVHLLKVPLFGAPDWLLTCFRSSR